ncbi:hypothetical protein GCM10022217_22560 [Chryseobacterium ginsenosidimutans]|uniref:hypothetical protein n=1 Tax=Chryseobacterium ginsenosidimutans TaxID=687846 RepID=UPI0031D498D2
MNKTDLPFKIGKQYEKWELDLILLPSKIKENELFTSYLYVGNQTKTLLGFPPHRIELLFQWDILSIVIMTFLDRDVGYYNKILNVLEVTYGVSTEIDKYEKVIQVFKVKNHEIWSNYSSGTVSIIYGNPDILATYSYFLLC